MRREREELKREREKLEREKLELVRFEKERQRQERMKLERERQELERLRRQQISGGSSRIGDDRRGSKRPAEDRDPYQSDRKRMGHRDEFSSANRSGVPFDANIRRQDDRAMVNRYERTSRDLMGGGDLQSSSRNIRNSREMSGSRGGPGPREPASSRDYPGGRNVGSSSRDMGSSRESSRHVSSDYRSSRSSGAHGSSHISHSSGASRSSGVSGSHGSHSGGSHRGSRGGHHGGGSSWSGSKSSSSSFSGGSDANFNANQGSMSNWSSRSVDAGMPSQNRNVALPAMDLPIGGIAPFAAQIATNAIMNSMGGSSIGASGSGSHERFDGYKPMMSNRRY